jgi:hypothetical protein
MMNDQKIQNGEEFKDGYQTRTVTINSVETLQANRLDGTRLWNILANKFKIELPLQQSEKGNTCVRSPYPNKYKRCDDPQLITRWSQTCSEASQMLHK